jgi:hypothetical protein
MKVLMVLCMVGLAIGGMSSASYEIPTHVLDGGGVTSVSSSYTMLDAVGQPTPIGVASSASYQGYLGYIYTIPMGPPAGLCGDANGDGSVTPSDGYTVLNYLGAGPSPVSCWAANAAGGDGITPADGYTILNYLGTSGTLTCEPCTFTVSGSGRNQRPEASEGRLEVR